MKKLIALLLSLVLTFSLTACGGSDSRTSANGSSGSTQGDIVIDAATSYFATIEDHKNIITADDFFAKMDAKENMFIMDVRQPDAYQTAHLKGAINVPYGTTIPEVLDFIPDDVPVYVNCYSGQTASQVVALLRIAGKKAMNIAGGYNGLSASENYEGHYETTENFLPTTVYAVAPEIKDAISNYFMDATIDAYASFLYPVDAVKELVDTGADTHTILSVRSAEDYSAGHIAGAINIPYAKDMQKSFSNIPKDKPVIVYCYTGQTACQVIAALRLLGYEAYSMPGGMGKEGGNGWLGAGNPVVQ